MASNSDGMPSFTFKARGQCAITNLAKDDMLPFLAICKASYSSSEDFTRGGLAETKFFVEESDHSLVLHVYLNKSKVMVQGNHTSVRWWIKNRFPDLLNSPSRLASSLSPLFFSPPRPFVNLNLALPHLLSQVLL